jgi:hypothetical protein
MSGEVGADEFSVVTLDGLVAQRRIKKRPQGAINA